MIRDAAVGDGVASGDEATIEVDDMRAQEDSPVCLPITGTRPLQGDAIIASALRAGTLVDVTVRVLADACVLTRLGSDVRAADCSLFGFDVAHAHITLRCDKASLQALTSAHMPVLVRLNRHACALVDVTRVDDGRAGEIVVAQIGLLARGGDGILYCEAVSSDAHKIVPASDMRRFTEKMRVLMHCLRDEDDWRYLSDAKIDRGLRGELRFGRTLDDLQRDLVALARLSGSFPVEVEITHNSDQTLFTALRDRNGNRSSAYPDIVISMGLVTNHYAGRAPLFRGCPFASGSVVFYPLAAEISILPVDLNRVLLSVHVSQPSALERAEAIVHLREAVDRIAREDDLVAEAIRALVDLEIPDDPLLRPEAMP